MAEESEVDRLDPVPVVIKLTSGFPVEVVRLRTRQLFRLMRIITRGATPQALSQLNFDMDDDEGRKKFAAQLLGIVIQAIPEAEQETIFFLQAMTRPQGIIDKPGVALTKHETEQNDALYDRFSRDMFNPDLEDFISLLEVIITAEAPDIQALGKKLTHLLQVARKAVGNGPPVTPPEGADLHSPDLTPSSSTS